MTCIIQNITQSFLIGGVVIAIATLISNYFSPLMVAIWLSYPFTVFATLISIYLSGKDVKYIKETAFRTVIALIISSIPVYYFSKMIQSRNDMCYTMLKASGVWIIVTIIVSLIQMMI